ncbi:hypothetical protein, partial [Serratia marcescens]|uniref:hypothetical protein n=1 Tax=Serratia marcescens TaxID=615 RepID=UPI002813FF74
PNYFETIKASSGLELSILYGLKLLETRTKTKTERSISACCLIDFLFDHDYFNRAAIGDKIFISFRMILPLSHVFLHSDFIRITSSHISNGATPRPQDRQVHKSKHGQRRHHPEG